MLSFTIKTIGCKVNTYESNKIKDELVKLGLTYIDVENKNEYKNLDFYIVNTCSVTSIADKKSRQMLHLAKKYNPNVKVIAIGCLVDSLFMESSRLEGVDFLLPNKEKDKLIKLILSFIKNKDVTTKFTSHSRRVRSFIKIQDGCNQYCTYCIIPYLRGSIKSRDNDDIINEIKEKVKYGVKEIVLTGIHLSSFGLDRVGLQYENDGAIEVARKSLLEIMERVAEIDGIERIRLGSLEPRIIDANFLMQLIDKNTNVVNAKIDSTGVDTVSSINAETNAYETIGKKFCANFCLSLQSGCDNTLKRMNRHYTTKDFEMACDLIRKYLPNATITADVIVGFPGETEQNFSESLEFVKKMRFYNPNIFPYSRRKGTKADEMDGQLTNQVKRDRARLMIAECERISKEIEEEYDKINHDILVEETFIENGITYGVGYTREYIKKKIEIKT